MHTLYELDFKKIAKGCEENWFGSTNLSNGTAPKDIFIDETEPFHLVQILFRLKEQQWNRDHWTLFTKKDILDILEEDTIKDAYIENSSYFGPAFVEEFPHQTNIFVTHYCNVVGEY